MGQGSINPVGKVGSPLEGLSHALDIVSKVYGVNTDIAKQKLLGSQLAQQDQETELGKQKLQDAQDAATPTSKRSQIAVAGHRSLLKELAKNSDVSDLDAAMQGDLSENDVKGLNDSGLLKLTTAREAQAAAAAIAGIRAKATVDSAKSKGTAGGGTLGGARADRNAMSLNKDYETSIKPYRTLQEDISKLEGSLKTKDKEGNPIITPQQLGDANQVIARIFSPNHMSDSTVATTEYGTYGTRVAAALQKLSANPKDTGARALVEHMLDQAHHIGNVSNQNALSELDSLDAGLEGLSPNLKKAGKTKSDNLRARFSKVHSTVGESGGGTGTDPTILEYAKAHSLDYPHAAEILKGRGYTGAAK